MTQIDLSLARPDQRPVLANLMQLYIHDFSEFLVGRPLGDLEEDGLFSPYPLDTYWQDDDHVPLLLRREGRLVGFALLNRQNHSGQEVDRNMAEFFIVRKHRRSGVGSAAVQAIFDRYPGLWETAVARRNVGAFAFWHGAITRHPLVSHVEQLDLQTAAWNGPLFRFRVANRVGGIP
jgi:predicted acetyltransferase